MTRPRRMVRCVEASTSSPTRVSASSSSKREMRMRRFLAVLRIGLGLGLSADSPTRSGRMSTAGRSLRSCRAGTSEINRPSVIEIGFSGGCIPRYRCRSFSTIGRAVTDPPPRSARRALARSSNCTCAWKMSPGTCTAWGAIQQGAPARDTRWHVRSSRHRRRAHPGQHPGTTRPCDPPAYGARRTADQAALTRRRR